MSWATFAIIFTAGTRLTLYLFLLLFAVNKRVLFPVFISVLGVLSNVVVGLIPLFTATNQITLLAISGSIGSPLIALVVIYLMKYVDMVSASRGYSSK